MEIEATSEEGQYYKIRFVRDEEGKVTECSFVTQGMEVEGVRIGG
ncbi:MAG: hypothetical protein PVF22_00315 [Candidatus Aminicenantes bacterium]|jgi:hypothetical protein